MKRLFHSSMFVLVLASCGGGGSSADDSVGPDERLLGVLVFGDLIRDEDPDVDVDLRMEVGPENSRILFMEVPRGQERVEGQRLEVGAGDYLVDEAALVITSTANDRGGARRDEPCRRPARMAARLAAATRVRCRVRVSRIHVSPNNRSRVRTRAYP